MYEFCRRATVLLERFMSTCYFYLAECRKQSEPLSQLLECFGRLLRYDWGDCISLGVTLRYGYDEHAALPQEL